MELAALGYEHRVGMDLGWIDKSAIIDTLYDRDNKTIYVVDLDSSKIASSNPNQALYLSPMGLSRYAPSKYQRDNQTGYVIADDNSDKYCYILMILNYLYGANVNNFSIEEFYSYLDYLNKIGVNNNLLKQFIDIISNKDNQNPYQYLETLTDNQIVRARRYVYDKVKKEYSNN